MAKTWGMNVPPELARDVGHVVERRVGDNNGVIGSRRGWSGIRRGGRKAVNDAFLNSVACWHIQTQPAKEDWYRQSQIAGMRYYNYFMSKTVGEFYNGHVPDWCKQLDDGMLQIPGITYDDSEFFDSGILAAGKRVFLDITIAWSNFKEFDFVQLHFYVMNLTGRMLQGYITIEGAAACNDYVVEEISDPDWGDYLKRGTVTGPSSVPVTFTLDFEVPSFFDLSMVMDSRVRLSSEFYDTGSGDSDLPVAWIYSYNFRLDTENIVENTFEGEDLQPLRRMTGFSETFIARPDPWTVWDYSFPVCVFGGEV